MITKDILEKSEYKFLKTNPHLKDNLLVLGLGGSHAYGTNVETSDIDIRGVAMNSKHEIILGRDFEQVVDTNTDTVVYSIKKMIDLLTKANPNTLEILGLRDDQILVSSPEWELIRQNANLFLSKKCIARFGGYANSQLRRLETKVARNIGQAKKEEYILGSIKHADISVFGEEVKNSRGTDYFELYIDDSNRENMEKEIYVNLNLHHYPLRKLIEVVNQYHSIVRDYDKLGDRNEKAIRHEKLGKHMMHLVRLYYMLFDILEYGEIITYREKEHDLLMRIRNNEFLKSNSEPTDEFYKLVDSLEERLAELKLTTKLPEAPDYEGIDNLLKTILEHKVNEKI